MNEHNKKHKEYFERSYKTGTDTTDDTEYTSVVLSFLRLLPHRGMVLDLGSGRGHWVYAMADLGMKVIGLDFVEDLTIQNNEDVKERGYAGKVAFMTGDVLDIPLQEETVDAITDFGTLQHIHPINWQDYQIEVCRVLRTGGILLLVELSRTTEQFLDFHPKTSDTGNVDLYGLHHHFFDRKEIEDIFGEQFSILKSEIHTFPNTRNLRYIFTILKKK